MKKRHLLPWILAASMVLVMAAGACIKYQLLKPLGLYQEKNIVELPFFLLSDQGALAAVRDAMFPPEETDPPVTTQEPQVTTEFTEPTEEPTTEAVTEPSTEPPTEPSTAPVTVPPTTVPPTTQPPETDPPAPVTTAPPVVNPTLEFSGDPVDWSWFDDVLFIGDSRTVGLRDYARAGNADYFCTVGMSSFNALKESTTASDDDFPEQTLQSLLASKAYGKIIIALGINECGYSTSSMIKQYKKVVQTVRDAQPDAVIILHSIMTVGRNKAAKGDHFHPEHLFMLNDKIKAVANGTDIFYIDVNEAFADSEGYLPSSFSKDGCHLYAKYTKYWADWIRYAVAGLGL